MVKVFKLLFAVFLQIADYTVGFLLIGSVAVIERNPALIREHYKMFIQINNAIYRSPIHWAINKFDYAKNTKHKAKENLQFNRRSHVR